MSIAGGGNLYPNWLGSASLTIPNNQVVINGKNVMVVPQVVGTSSNLSVWPNGNFQTFFTQSNVAPGTYLVGCEVFTDPLTASNAGAGWNQGDYFLSQISDNDLTTANALQLFVRPYTEGIQSNATTPYNKGGTNWTMSGLLVLTSNTNIKWASYLGKDVTTSYPQTRSLSMSGPYFQKIA